MQDVDPQYSTRSAALSLLQPWLARCAVSISPKLRLVQNPSSLGFDYSIHANAAIDLDEILSVIPKSIVISKRTSSLSSNPLFSAFCEKVSKDDRYVRASETLILSVVVLHELLLGKASKWHIFLESCPGRDETDLPAFWQDSEVGLWLRNTDVQSLIKYQASDEASGTIASSLPLELKINVLLGVYVALLESVFQHLCHSTFCVLLLNFIFTSHISARILPYFLASI